VNSKFSVGILLISFRLGTLSASFLGFGFKSESKFLVDPLSPKKREERLFPVFFSSLSNPKLPNSESHSPASSLNESEPWLNGLKNGCWMPKFD